MASCLWKNLVVVALMVALTGAAVVIEEEAPTEAATTAAEAAAEAAETSFVDSVKSYYDTNKNQLVVHAALLGDLGYKIGKSFKGVSKATEGLAKNFGTYFEKTVEQVVRDSAEHMPHFKAFYDAIPAPAFKKLILSSLRTVLKQSQDHCGKIDLEYYPLHPGLSAQELRRKRDTEKMTLAKFGQAISTLFTDVDNFTVEYFSKSVPMLCSLSEEWLKAQIANGEALEPEEFKKNIFKL